MSNKTIPIFPDFKKLSLSDKNEIEEFTKLFAPYSDYNFVSMYCYDTQNLTEVSYLNDNLVVLFEDYITEEPVYSFLGINNLEDTAGKLLEKAYDLHFSNFLKLIPEGNFGDHIHGIVGFDAIEDPDNFDYILSVDKLSKLEGGEFQDKRNLYNRFKIENSDAEIRNLNLSDIQVKNDVMNLFRIWVEKKGKSIEETIHEEKAIKKLLDSSEYFNLVSIGIYKNNVMICFAISEVINGNFAVFHFVKGNTDYKGTFETTYNALAKELKKRGVIFINYEQHLGIENLKKSKELWRPVGYLKKYIITRKE